MREGNHMRRAPITAITGQDGLYLSELLKNGYGYSALYVGRTIQRSNLLDVWNPRWSLSRETCWSPCVGTDASLFRPAEVDRLIGDVSRAHAMLPWNLTASFERRHGGKE